MIYIMRPTIWGPPAWTLLHSITLEYPDCPTKENKTDMINFINALGQVLPCNQCKNHFKDNLKMHPLTNTILSSKTELAKWMIDMHNDVNKINDKEVLSYEDALKQILAPYDKKDITNQVIVFIMIFIIIMGIIVYLMANKVE